MHAHPVRHFRLSSHKHEGGISCDANGAFIDNVSLLERIAKNGRETWVPRDSDKISADLSARYDLPIDISSKANGLVAIATALNKNEIARAQLAALFLRFPEMPQLRKDAASKGKWIKFVRELAANKLLKATWEPEDHPRWPGGAADSQGGRFAPKGEQIESSFASSDPVLDDATGKKPSQQTRLRPWTDVASGLSSGYYGGPPLWMIMMFEGPGEIEAAENFVSTLRPGPFAKESIPASGPKLSARERVQIKDLKAPCHTCGEPNATIGDHQPPTRLTPPGKPQRLYPHCANCSGRQGAEVTAFLKRVGDEFKAWYESYARKRARAGARSSQRAAVARSIF